MIFKYEIASPGESSVKRHLLSLMSVYTELYTGGVETNLKRLYIHTDPLTNLIGGAYNDIEMYKLDIILLQTLKDVFYDS